MEGTLETDDALDFVTTVVASHAGEARWLSIWLVPDGLDASARYRFVVRSTSGRTLRAAPFTLGQARQEWGFVGLVDLRRAGASRP